MNNDIYNDKQNSKNDEVDVIRLLNYFKNGIKTIFRMMWRVVEAFIQFIILLRKNWIIVTLVTLIGCLFGFYVKYIDVKVKTYEMVVRANPTSNIELYAISNEINSQQKFNPKFEGEGIKVAKQLGIEKLKIEPIKRSEDVVNSYFNQIEGNPIRADQTDTIYYLAFPIDKHKDLMVDFDFSIQKLQFKVKNETQPNLIQDQFLNYLNNLPGVKSEQENKLAVLKSYERVLTNSLNNIDSLFISKAFENKKGNAIGSEQLLVNTASRGTVEGDLLRYTEIFSKKLFGVKKEISHYQKGINVISDIRLVEDDNLLNNSIIKYTILGFLISCLVILLIQFNKYLNKFSERKKI